MARQKKHERLSALVTSTRARRAVAYTLLGGIVISLLFQVSCYHGEKVVVKSK